MHARFVLIAAATLMTTTAFAAEPAKPAPQPPAHHESATPKVVLASANIEEPPAPATQQAPATPKRRVGRVTSCRCGDQQAQPDDE